MPQSTDWLLLSLFFPICLPWPLLWSCWWMLHKQSSGLAKNQTLIILGSTDNERRCEGTDRPLMMLEQHPDCDCKVSIKVRRNGHEQPVKFLFFSNSRWVSGWPPVRRTSQLPHLGWPAWKGENRETESLLIFIAPAFGWGLEPCLFTGAWGSARK